MRHPRCSGPKPTPVQTTSTNDASSVIEAYLLIEQPRQRLGHWSNALAALDSPFAPTARAVVAYYDPTCDQAVLNLQYDGRTLEESGLQYVVNVALLAEVGMVQPAALSEGERARFLGARLSRCTLRVTSQHTAVGALGELVRRIREARGPSTAKPPPIPAAARASVAPRGNAVEADSVITAKGTRDNLEKIVVDAMEAASAVDSVVADATDSTSITAEVRSDRHSTLKMPPRQSAQLARETVDAPVARMDAPVGLRAQPRETHPRVPLPAELAAQHREGDARGEMIFARYLRGGRWLPVRVGALSLKGAALLTGALPRVHDRVDIALAFGPHRALVRGWVAKVSTVREASATGAATFSVGFELDTASRKQLRTLLLAARDAKITIKPPPPRATRRFPVEWHVMLGTTKGAVRAVACDVSTGGMFVRPACALELGTIVGFSVVLDDASAPITGGARVVRRITEAEARAYGLVAGFGLAIVEISEADRMRWLGFLARIERRADKRVLIGADPTRLAELQAGLASLGYAVVGGTDPGALVQLANADARPADAVLIDEDWLHGDSSTALVESLFTARNVPCVTTHGEVRRARQAIDQLLEVVV